MREKKVKTAEFDSIGFTAANGRYLPFYDSQPIMVVRIASIAFIIMLSVWFCFLANNYV